MPFMEFCHVQATYQDGLQCAAAIQHRDSKEDLGFPADLSD